MKPSASLPTLAVFITAVSVQAAPRPRFSFERRQNGQVYVPRIIEPNSETVWMLKNSGCMSFILPLFKVVTNSHFRTIFSLYWEYRSLGMRGFKFYAYSIANELSCRDTSDTPAEITNGAAIALRHRDDSAYSRKFAHFVPALLIYSSYLSAIILTGGFDLRSGR